MPERHGQAHEHEVLVVHEQEDQELGCSQDCSRHESDWHREVSNKENWLAVSLETLGGKVFSVGKFDATHSWDTVHIEKAFKRELTFQGFVSKFQAVKLISSIPHPHGMPSAVWNPRGVYPTRVAKKMKVDPGVNRAFKNFDAVDAEHLADGWDKLKVMGEELPAAADSDSDSESDSDMPEQE